MKNLIKKKRQTPHCCLFNSFVDTVFDAAHVKGSIMQPPRHWDKINAAGLKEYSDCNHMAVPTVFIMVKGLCFMLTLECDFQYLAMLGLI